jgi:hypothetical protein
MDGNVPPGSSSNEQAHDPSHLGCSMERVAPGLRLANFRPVLLGHRRCNRYRAARWVAKRICSEEKRNLIEPSIRRADSRRHVRYGFQPSLRHR